MNTTKRWFEGLKAGRGGRKYLRKAKTAKNFYRRGYETSEIAILMGTTAVTVRRYFQAGGGIEKLDEATHMKNKYLNKLPEKDKLKGRGLPQ